MAEFVKSLKWFNWFLLFLSVWNTGLFLFLLLVMYSDFVKENSDEA